MVRDSIMCLGNWLEKNQDLVLAMVVSRLKSGLPTYPLRESNHCSSRPDLVLTDVHILNPSIVFHVDTSFGGVPADLIWTPIILGFAVGP